MARHYSVVALVGQPNVGKSVIMNLLTGAGAMVSNYPGTTVELTQSDWVVPVGQAGADEVVRFIDTPGVYSLHSDTEEQRVTQRVLLERNVDLIVNVADARALDRSLYLTLQLIDLDIPMIVVLNQMDLAREVGLHVDPRILSKALGVPVVPMVASKGTGLEDLQEALEEALWGFVPVERGAGPFQRSGVAVAGAGPVAMVFSNPVEEIIGLLTSRITAHIPAESGKHHRHPARALAIHLLECDSLDEALFKKYPWLKRTVEVFQKDMSAGHFCCDACFRGCSFCPRAEGSAPFLTCLERSTRARTIAGEATRKTLPARPGFRSRLEVLLDSPWPGIPLLLCIVGASLAAISQFMEYAEDGIEWFVGHLTTILLAVLGRLSLGGTVRFVVGAAMDSILLPFAVVMPAMLSIYVVMALLEDSGLLPRIAVALDRAMSVFGLPGHSTIPIVLGFGCKAPAVLATRVLGDKRSRLVVSALIAITVPCAASFAIITGVSEHFEANLKMVYGSMITVFVLLGLVMGRVFSSGEPLVLEIPPIRFPVISNVWEKVKMRLSGFFREVLPILTVTGVLVSLLVESGALEALSAVDPVTYKLFGIRGQSAVAVLVSMIQRYMAPMVLLNGPRSHHRRGYGLGFDAVPSGFLSDVERIRGEVFGQGVRFGPGFVGGSGHSPQSYAARFLMDDGGRVSPA